jgi:chromosomal replication initiation ATPase DnaA
MRAQLAFSFYTPIYYSECDYVLSCSNLEAYKCLSTSDKWPEGRLIIIGEEGSGKTHLANIWQQLKNAVFINESSELSYNKGQNLICENIQNIQNEEFLFHLINFCKAQEAKLLLTAAKLDQYALPDLQSRINATSKILIRPPDDNLLRVILMKWFVDKQLLVAEEVIEFIIARVERSYSYIKGFMLNLDQLSLEEKRSITIPLVKKVLERMSVGE